MAVTTKPIGNKAPTNPGQLVKLVRELMQDLEDQLNERAQVYSSTDGRVPAGLKRNDILIVSNKGKISVLVRTARGYDTLKASDIGGMPAAGTQFLGIKSGAAVVSLADFPNPNDWGYYQRTGPVTVHHCININNILYTVQMT